MEGFHLFSVVVERKKEELTECVSEEETGAVVVHLPPSAHAGGVDGDGIIAL